MKNYKTFFENIIINNIDFEGYNITLNGHFDKVHKVYEIFKKEFVHDNNKHLNENKLFAEWLQGLPSVLTVPFYNFEILQNGLLNGFDLSTEEKEYKFLSEYWINLSNAFFNLKNNL